MFKTNSEKVFLVVMVVMAIVLFGALSGCALLDKFRMYTNPHQDMLIEVPVVEGIEDVRG